MTPEQLAEEITRAADGDPLKAGAILTRIIWSDRSDGPAMMERKTAFAQNRHWHWTFGWTDPQTGKRLPGYLCCVESDGRTENPRVITVSGLRILDRFWRTHRLKFMTDGYPRLVERRPGNDT